jgi:hypothetical protein
MSFERKSEAWAYIDGGKGEYMEEFGLWNDVFTC